MRGFIAFMVLALSGAAFAADEPPVLPVGSALPAFSLARIDGKTYTDKSFKSDLLVHHLHVRALPDGAGL